MQTEPIEAVSEQIDTDFDGHVERIQRAVRQPSVSVEHRGLRETATLAVEYLEDLGCSEAELIETDGAPGVWGYYDAGAETTIVNYGMLDTRPVGDESEWTHDPFSGEVTTHEQYGDVLYGRGSVKVKGAYVAWLNALDAMRKALGDLPVNVAFLLEVEEINGSPHYYDMLADYEDRIAEADACLCPLAGQAADGSVTASLGYKSALYFDLVVSGEQWGRGPEGGSIHAMSNATVDSPAWRLVDVLSSLTTDNGRTIDIKGYYEQYEPPNDEERAEIQAFVDDLAATTDVPREELWRRLPGLGRGEGQVDRLRDDLQEDVVEAFVRHFYGPESFNVQGIRTGYLGPGTDTKPFTIPSTGRATFDLRMPRGYDPAITRKQLRDHLDEKGFEDVELDVSGQHTWCKTDPDSTLVEAVQEVLNRHDVELTLQPFSAGGVPWAVFGTRFNISLLYGVGLGYGENSTGADEFLVIEGNDTVAGLAECERSHAEMLLAYTERRA